MGGYFYWKVVSDFPFRWWKPCFWRSIFLINAYILVIWGTLKKGFPWPAWKIRNHFPIEIPPPKLTFHTFRSISDHSKVLFWLPSDFWRIFSNNVKQQMPISQNMFDHKATKMVPIVLDLWVDKKSKWKLWHFSKISFAKLKCQFCKMCLITKLQKWYQ